MSQTTTPADERGRLEPLASIVGHVAIAGGAIGGLFSIVETTPQTAPFQIGLANGALILLLGVVVLLLVRIAQRAG